MWLRRADAFAEDHAASLQARLHGTQNLMIEIYILLNSPKYHQKLANKTKRMIRIRCRRGYTAWTGKGSQS